jgi:DNA-binding transcriptional LysR family regulator
MITHHQLRTFLAVARTGSLTRAARDLNATQPTVSLQLNALRKFLGTPLFERAGGRFQLTAAGERLRHYAEGAMADLRSLQQDVALLRPNLPSPREGVLTGPLAVGFTWVVSRYVISSVLSRFLGQFPAVEVHIAVEVPEPLFSRLLRNSLDVACLMDVAMPPGLTAEMLCEEELVIFVSNRHPLAGRRKVAPAELTTHPFVASLSPPLRTLVDAKLRSVGVTPRVAAEALHHEAIKKFVERDLGYSMLIESAVADELASGQLVKVPLDAPSITTQLVAIYRTRPTLSPVIRGFIDFIRTELSRDRKRPVAPRRPPVSAKIRERSTPRTHHR